MINKITDGVSIKLNELFGDGYNTYTENVKQGLQEPCFFIKALKVLTNPLLGKRKERIYPFDIAYFTNGGNEEMMRVGEQMLDGLEYITLTNGDIVRCRSIEMEIVDDVLHVSVTYPVTLISNEARADAMGTLIEVVGTKGD